MGADGMVSPETGINRFAVSTPTKERIEAPPVLPKTFEEPAPHPPKPELPPEGKSRRAFLKTAAKVAGGVVGSLILGGGALEILKRISAQSGSAEENPAAVPPTLDNRANKQVFGENSIKRIIPEEARAQDLLSPKFDEGDATLTVMSPFIIPTGTTAIIDRSEYEVRTIKHNEPRVTVPAGTGIVIPEGMHYLLIGGNPEWNQDPNLVYGISALKYDPDTNTSINISLSFYNQNTGKDMPISTTLKITPQQDLAPSDFMSYSEYWKSLPISDGQTPSGMTVNDQLVNVNVAVYKGTDYSSGAEKVGLRIKNVRIEWQRQDGKLLVLAPFK